MLKMKPASALETIQPSGKSGYSFEVKQDVCQKMLTLGNRQLVAALTGIDYTTIYKWQKTDWWKELEDSIRFEQGVKLDTKLSQVIDKSLDIVVDRLENGEQVLNNKTGELMQKPVSMKDAAVVSNNLLQRQQVLRRTKEEVQEKKESMKDILSTLASEFAKYSLRSQNHDAEDIPFIEPEEK